MKLALLLWLAAILKGATLAVPRCNHFQVGALFIAFAAVPTAVYAWRLCITSNRNPRAKQPVKP